MASSADMALNLILKLKDEASEKLGGMKEKLGGVKLAALGIAGAAVAGVGALTAGLIDAGRAAAEEEVGIAKLAAAVTASGGNWDTASAAIENYLTKELARTALDDGEGREAIGRLTTATGDYQQALDLMGLTQDLAAAKGMDLASAAELVGKVASGNTGALARYGIVLEEGATSQEALAAMQAKFAGQAEAYGNTTEGAQKRLGIALGNLKETVGTAVTPVLTKLAEVGADLAQRALPIVQKAIDDLKPVFERVFTWIKENVVPVIKQIVEYVQEKWPEVQAVIEPILRDVWALIQDIIGALVEFWKKHHDRIEAIAKTIWKSIGDIIDTAIKVVRDIIKTITALIHGDWEGAWEGVKQLAFDIWEGIKRLIEDKLNIILSIFGTNLHDLIETGKTKFAEFVEKIKTALNIDWGQLGKDIVQGIANGLGAFGGLLVDAAKRLAGLALDAIKNFFHIGTGNNPGAPSSGAAVDLGAGLAGGLAEGIRRGGGGVTRAVKTIIEDAIAEGREVVKSMLPLIAVSSETLAAYNRLAAKEGGIITAAGAESLAEREALGRTDVLGGREALGRTDIPGGREEPSPTGRGGTSELIIRLYWNDREAGKVTANLIDGESQSVTLNVVAGVL